MSTPQITHCPGTLAAGHHTYSRTCLARVFLGRKVHHVLPFNSPTSSEEADTLFLENRKHISISGVQEKFSVLMEKNKLRLTTEGEHGAYILKPKPAAGKNRDQMPANEHLTMQIARQVYDMETAENALIFFKDGLPAYITRRFDVTPDGQKLAMHDFATLANKTPYTHGTNYKYTGNYLELFDLMKVHLPSYTSEAPKLFQLLLFNYLYSNGDAHIKNFSLLETPLGDFRLCPCYDLLNSRIHIDDRDFALEDGLLPKHLAKGKIMEQFRILGDLAEINPRILDKIIQEMTSNEEKVKNLIEASFLSDTLKRNYLQAYQMRLNKLTRE
jgi:serine/threonine-protein kinase HipA